MSFTSFTSFAIGIRAIVGYDIVQYFLLRSFLGLCFIVLPRINFNQYSEKGHEIKLANLLFIPKLGDINIYPKIFFESFLSRAEVTLIVPPVEEDIKITFSPIFEPISNAS